MDSANIPKSFWHALSFCMISATLGLISIAYRASSVSIEIADAKINLSSAISEVKDIKNELEQENKNLRRANQELQAKLKEADPVVRALPDSPQRRDITQFLNSLPNAYPAKTPALAPQRFEALDLKIQRIEQYVAPARK